MKEPEEWDVEEIAAFFKKALGKPDVTNIGTNAAVDVCCYFRFWG